MATMKSKRETTEQRLLSVAEVADRFGLARQTIYNQLSRGLFPLRHKKIGRLVRFDSRELDEYIKSLPDYG